MIKADYTIELQDGSKINLLFNTWTFRNYSYKTGIEFEGLFDITQAVKTKDLPLLLISAADSFSKYNSEAVQPSYTDADACLWLDEIGFTFLSDKVKDIYAICISKLTGKPWEQVKKEMQVVAKETIEKEEDKGPKKKRVAS